MIELAKIEAAFSETLLGTMNDGWYIARSSIDEGGNLFFRHPYDQGGTEG